MVCEGADNLEKSSDKIVRDLYSKLDSNFGSFLFLRH